MIIFTRSIVLVISLCFILPITKSAEIVLDNDTLVVCLGESTILTPCIEVENDISWTPATSLNNPFSESPIATPTQSTTYTLTTSTLGQNLIFNGDFEQGNDGFYTQYDTAQGGILGPLTNEGQYLITQNTNFAQILWDPCTDHTSGSTNLLAVNGATITNQAIWCQSVSIVPNTYYQFSTWLTSCENSNPPSLQFSINGELIGSSFNGASILCEWNEFFENWYSNSDTLAEICIVNQNTEPTGNDFALDDISFKPIETSTCEITVLISSPNITITDTIAPCNSSCDGTISINSTNIISSEYSYQWNFNNQLDTSFVDNLCSGIYSVTVTDSFYCSDSISVELNELPVIDLTVQTTPPLCFGDSNGSVIISPINGTPPYSYNWGNINPDSLSSGNYSVTVFDYNLCSSTLDFNIDQPEALFYLRT